MEGIAIIRKSCGCFGQTLTLTFRMALLQTPFLTRNNWLRQPHCVVVDSEESLQRLERTLQRHSPIALDTESNSCHSYAPRLCLVQFAVQRSQPGGAGNLTQVFLLDPQQVDLGRLRRLFANPDKLFLLHSAANDLGQLWLEYRISIANLFDTQVAARLIGLKRTALATLLEQQFDVVQSKNIQTSDWGRKPLSASQTAYACQDVAYLIPLYRSLLHELRATGKLHEGLAVMEEIVRRDYTRFGSSTKTFWDHHATKRVPIHLMNVYQRLWNWREQKAKAADLPRYKVIGDRSLLLLTREQPSSLSHLRKYSGLSSSQIRRYGTELLAVIERGQRTRQPVSRPVAVNVEMDSEQREQQRNLMQQLRKWRQEMSLRRGVDSDFVLSKHILQVIVENAPVSLEDLARSNLLVDWKLKHYGSDVIRIVRNAALPLH